MTCLMCGFPLGCIFKNRILWISSLLNQLFQGYCLLILWIYVILNNHLRHFHMISDSENLKNHEKRNFNILYTLVLFQACHQFSRLILVNYCYLMWMLKPVAVLTQNITLNCFILYIVFYLQFVHFHTFGKVQGPLIALYYKIPS